jgi:hypothetical protein
LHLKLKNEIKSTCILLICFNFILGGCTSYKTSSLQRHSACHEHLQSIEAARCEKDMQVAASKFNDKNNAFLITCLKSALFLATNELPTSLFGNLQKFIKSQGCETSTTCSNNIRYEHNNSVNELQAAIAKVIENKLLCDLNQAKVCALICDETCDNSNEKHLGSNIRFVKNGNVITKFLENVTVSDGTAETLTNSITEMLKEKHIDISKIIGLGCDGANVMLGKHSGVAARLKVLNPSIISVHCAAHRLALVLQSPAKTIQCIKSYNDTIKSVFFFLMLQLFDHPNWKQFKRLFKDSV